MDNNTDKINSEQNVIVESKKNIIPNEPKKSRKRTITELYM